VEDFSCSTTTSGPSRSARSRSCAGRTPRSAATARLPSARSPRSPTEEQFPSRSASSPTSSSPRFVVDGVVSARIASRMMDAGCRSIGRRRHRDGSGDGRRAASTPSLRHRRRLRTTTATWFKVAARATASPRCRWTSCVGHHHRGDTKALDQRAPRAGCHILEKMQAALPASRQNISSFARASSRSDSGRQDPRRHRPGRQDDPQHHLATGVKIDVEDDGRVNVASADAASARRRSRSSRAHGHAELTRPTWARCSASPISARSSDHAGHRRPAARLRDREPPRQGRAR